MKTIPIAIAIASSLLLSPLAHADLIGHWPFEEGSGTTTADLSAGNNDLTFDPADASGPEWSSADLPPVGSGSNAAIRFDGSGDRLLGTGYKMPEITGTNPRTMAAWVKSAPGSEGTNMGIIAYGQDQAGDKWILRVQNGNGPIDGNLRVEVNGGYTVGTTIVTDGEWHHVAATFEDDGSPDVLDVLLYVDGQLEVVSASLDEVIHTDTAAGIDLRIGDDHSNRKWNGWIDEVRIYDEVLDADAILALATTPPIITSFTADAEAVAVGGPLTLSWEVDEFDALSIDNGVGDVAPQTQAGEGSIVVMPNESTDYTLTATLGETTLERSISVLAGEAPTINNFAGSGSSAILAGGSVTLRFDAFGEDSLSITPAPGDVSGETEATVTPAETTVYTLSATNAFGTSTAELTVTVLPAGSPDLSWTAADIDDGVLTIWNPTINSTGNNGILFNNNTGGTVMSGGSNFVNISKWVNSPGFNMASNPADSFHDGLGDAATKTNVTWELVFRPGDFTGTHTLFNTGGNGDGTAFTIADSTLDFRFQDANNDDQRLIVSVDLATIGAADDFYHVVGLADVDSAPTGPGSLYVNGQLVAGPTTSTGNIDDWDGGDLAELGKGNNIPGANPFNPAAFNGDIALFNYYGGRLLSDQTIMDAYTAIAGNAAPFAITGILYNAAAQRIELTFNSSPGRTYAVDSSTDLRAGNWLEVDDSIESGGTETTYFIGELTLPDPALPVQFYRVRSGE